MVKWKIVYYTCCVFFFILPDICKGKGDSATENQMVTTDANTSYIGSIYVQLLRDLYVEWGISITNMALLADTEGKGVAYAIMNKMDPGIKVLFKEKENQDITDLVTEMIYNTDSQNFVFIVSETEYSILLKQILELNLDLPSRVWIFVSTKPDTSIWHQISDLCCRINVYVIGQLQVKAGINGTAEFRGIIKECSENNGNSSVIKMNPSSRSNVISNKSSLKQHFNKTMRWDTKNGIQHINKTSRIPSKDVYLRVVGLHEAPFLYRNGDGFIGYHMDILDYISRYVGFKYKVYDCDQNLYGYRNITTNKWSGCVSDLVYGRADIVAAPLHLLSKREAVIDYIIPWTGYSGIIILAKQEARQYFNFASAFTLGLWSTVGLTFILSCFMIFLFVKVLRSARTDNGQNVEGHNNKINFQDVVWFLMSSSAFEGTRKTPKGCSIRILIAGFWIFINILMSVFLGNVAAFLMSSSLKIEINSFSDLIKQHTFHFSCWRDSSVSAHIHDMSNIEKHMQSVWTRSNLDNETFSSADQTVWTNPLGDKYTQLWHGIVKSGFVNTTGEALERIKDGNYMFVTDSAIAEFLATDDCNLKTIGRKISARPYGFGIRKHSSLKENISKAYLELQHHSEMHEIRRRWWKVRNDCPVGYDDRRMNLSEMAGCFFTVLMGSVLGIIVLNIEYFISKCKDLRRCTVVTD